MKTKKDTRHETLKALHIQVIEAEGDYLEAIQKVKKAIAARDAAAQKFNTLNKALAALKANQEGRR